MNFNYSELVIAGLLSLACFNYLKPFAFSFRYLLVEAKTKKSARHAKQCLPVAPVAPVALESVRSETSNQDRNSFPSYMQNNNQDFIDAMKIPAYARKEMGINYFGYVELMEKTENSIDNVDSVSLSENAPIAINVTAPALLKENNSFEEYSAHAEYQRANSH